jgi:hypothetical protein
MSTACSLSIPICWRASCLLLILLSCSPSKSLAQKPAGAGTNNPSNSSLPDSPAPKADANPVENTPERFVGYITNRSIAFPDIAYSPGPLSVRGKFKQFVNESISPAYILQSAIAAGYGQAINSPKGFGQGWDAYGDRFGASMARDSSNAFFSSFVFATALREDPRFFPQSHPSLWGSVKYSARRIFVTRTDSGHQVFNYSGMLGPAAAESLAIVYLPPDQHTGGKILERYGTDLGWRFAGNMFKNYWPTFFHNMGLNKLKVIPDPGQPVSSDTQH